MPLVEVVCGEHTSDETVNRSMTLIKSMNKKPILVKKDVLGQNSNHLQYAIFREAQYMLEEGIASMDMGGLDTNASITSYLFEDLSDRKEIFPRMKELVDSGNYGSKTGKGFYDWPKELIEKFETERELEVINWMKKIWKTLKHNILNLQQLSTCF